MTWKNDKYRHKLASNGIRTSYKGKINPKYKRMFVVWEYGESGITFNSYFEALLFIHNKMMETGKWGEYLVTEQINDRETNEFIREKKLAKIKAGKVEIEG